ncbi:hypothetical protein HMSSN139_19590 [Paenibacillus sp. HMSSN-139]|nr:hypothetical protein HMSSN139_19590 [Paenibacillus sp. HMSSN-139]
MLLSVEQLMDIYYKSVGHGATLLLNAAPDDRGLIPESDVLRLREFGREIQRRFDQALAETSGDGDRIEVGLGGMSVIDHFVMMEDLAYGERVLEYVLEARVDGQWLALKRGSAIGHKKIDAVAPVRTDKIRLRIMKASAVPKIRKLAVYCCGGDLT